MEEGCFPWIINSGHWVYRWKLLHCGHALGTGTDVVAFLLRYSEYVTHLKLSWKYMIQLLFKQMMKEREEDRERNWDRKRALRKLWGVQVIFPRGDPELKCVPFLFLRFYFMRSIFKVFLEFVTILLLLYVLVFWPQRVWDLSSLTGDWTHTTGRRCLNH